jgi:hypothetical protein
VVAYLLSAVREEKHGGSHRLSLTVRKRVIASRLNVTQELARSGLISVVGREISIADVRRLRQCAPQH